MARKWDCEAVSRAWGILLVWIALSGAGAATPSAIARHGQPRRLAVAPPQAPVTTLARDDLLKVPPAASFGLLDSPTRSVSPAVTENTSPGQSDVVLDSSLRPSQRLTGPDFLLTPSQGILKTGNLFLSFAEFDLANGDIASFTGPATVRNVFARVTDGQPSNINGTISCTIPNADLYLINPAGVVFGPDAALDIRGSLAVTTANLLRLSGGGSFDASTPSASMLSSAAPSAFGFLSAPSTEVNVNGSIVGVRAGRSITIVAGKVGIDGGEVSAPGGRISIAAVNSSGTANLNAADPALALQTTSFARLGSITMSNGAEIRSDGANGPGGFIQVQSDSLTLSNARISANTTGPGKGGGIDLRLRGPLTSTASVIASDTASAGVAGDLRLAAGSLSVNGGTIETNTSGSGAGGDITVDVAGAAVVNGRGNINAGITSLATDIDPGAGAAGTVSIAARSLTVQAGATINASTYGGGNGGTIDVSVFGALILNGAGARQPDESNAEATGIGSASFLQTGPGGGSAGKVNVSAGALSLINGGQIDGSTFSTGDGGDLNVTVSGLIMLDGSARAQRTRPIFTSISAENFGFGRAGGNVTVNAGSLSMREANINAETIGSGKSGSVVVNVAGHASLDGMGFFVLPDPTSGIEGFATGIFAGSLAPNGGAAGNVFVRSGSLLTQRGAIIDTSTFGTGSAGKVTVWAGKLVILNGGGISSFTTGEGSGGDVNVAVSGSARLDGSATPPTLGELFGGVTGVGADTIGGGEAGQVHVDIEGRLALTGGAQISTKSIMHGGPAGSVGVNAHSGLTISGGGAITASSNSSSAGDVRVSSEGTILVDGGTVSALASQKQAGDVTLSSPLLIQLAHHARITTASAGANGGSISLDALELIVPGGIISADAPEGVGGNISVAADATPGLVFTGPLVARNLTATGRAGVSGNIEDSPANTDIAQSVTSLPVSLNNGELTLQPQCGAMLDVSSFVVQSGGAAPAEPDRWQLEFNPTPNRRR